MNCDEINQGVVNLEVGPNALADALAWVQNMVGRENRRVCSCLLDDRGSAPPTAILIRRDEPWQMRVYHAKIKTETEIKEGPELLGTIIKFLAPHPLS